MNTVLYRARSLNKHDRATSWHLHGHFWSFAHCFAENEM